MDGFVYPLVLSPSDLSFFLQAQLARATASFTATAALISQSKGQCGRACWHVATCNLQEASIRIQMLESSLGRGRAGPLEQRALRDGEPFLRVSCTLARRRGRAQASCR